MMSGRTDRPWTPPRPRPMVRKTAGPNWTDEQFVKKRTCMRQGILRHLRRHHSTPQLQPRMPKLAEQLEEILHTKFPSKNEYCNMMRRGVKTQVPLACKLLNAQIRQNRENRQVARQTTSSSSTNTLTPFSTAWWLNLSVQGTEPVDTGPPQHQPMGDMALSGADQQFEMLRTATREKIIEYIERRPGLPAEWDKGLSALVARRYEDTLYTKFPNMNDYCNMMKGPIAPPLLFAMRTYKAQRQQNQPDSQMARETASSSSTITPDVNHDDLCEQFASLMTE